jgi:hypothetical protein
MIVPPSARHCSVPFDHSEPSKPFKTDGWFDLLDAKNKPSGEIR